MASTTVLPNGDGSIGSWTDFSLGTSSLFTTVDEDPSSPDDANGVQCLVSSNAIFFLLGDMPADFAVATGVSITIRAKRDTSKGDFRGIRGFRLYKADETTALVADTTVSITTSYANYTGTPTITGSTDKTSWNGTRIKIDTDAGSVGTVSMTAIKVVVTYTAASGRVGTHVIRFGSQSIRTQP